MQALSDPSVDAAGQIIGKVGTSDIAKYQLGAFVDQLGPDRLAGFIVGINPRMQGATSGPGELVIGSDPPE